MRRRHLQAFALLAALLPSPAVGERLPIRAYTTADGLAHNEINKIVRDARGFMWFATNDGLSRFDGYAFSNYSVEQGLPHPTVRDLLETKGGELLIATYGGVVRFDPHGIPAAGIVYANDVRGPAPMFTTIVPHDEDPRARAVVVLFESRDGTIWCGTKKGLFRLDRSGVRVELRPVDIGLPQRVRELADAIDAGADPLPDPDPPLNEVEQQGKAIFARACAQCHGGPGQSTTPVPIVRYHGIFTQCPRPVDPFGRWNFAPCPPRLARTTRLYEVTRVDGVKLRLPSSDPGRALLTGFITGPNPADDWNKFDVPTVRGINRTAPYFHNNSAATLEEVVDHYIELFKFIEANFPTFPPGLPKPLVASTTGEHFDRQIQPGERAALLAYLRKQ